MTVVAESEQRQAGAHSGEVCGWPDTGMRRSWGFTTLAWVRVAALGLRRVRGWGLRFAENC